MDNIPKSKKEIKAEEQAKEIMEAEMPEPVVSDINRSAIYSEYDGKWSPSEYSLPLTMEDVNDEFDDYVKFEED